MYPLRESLSNPSRINSPTSQQGMSPKMVGTVLSPRTGVCLSSPVTSIALITRLDSVQNTATLVGRGAWGLAVGTVGVEVSMVLVLVWLFKLPHTIAH